MLSDHFLFYSKRKMSYVVRRPRLLGTHAEPRFRSLEIAHKEISKGCEAAVTEKERSDTPFVVGNCNASRWQLSRC